MLGLVPGGIVGVVIHVKWGVGDMLVVDKEKVVMTFEVVEAVTMLDG